MFRQQPLRQLKYVVLILALCCCLTGCGSQASAVSQVHHPDGPALNSVITPTPTLPTPQHLLIPAINVNAPIEAVDILPDGDLGTPNGSPWTDTGWYASGPRPGEQGSAVIDGHLDRPGGYPAVFWDLRKVKIGDDVDVVNSAGATLHFNVTDVEYYPPQNAPLQLIFGNNGGKYLNLVTCAGDWIPSQHQTTLREVVYTTLVP